MKGWTEWSVRVRQIQNIEKAKDKKLKYIGEQYEYWRNQKSLNRIRGED